MKTIQCALYHFYSALKPRFIGEFRQITSRFNIVVSREKFNDAVVSTFHIVPYCIRQRDCKNLLIRLPDVNGDSLKHSAIKPKDKRVRRCSNFFVNCNVGLIECFSFIDRFKLFLKFFADAIERQERTPQFPLDQPRCLPHFTTFLLFLCVARGQQA